MNKEEFINHLKEINKGLSIIITAYNSQDFIEECLDSIQNQTYFKYNDKYEILLGIDACEKTLKKVNVIRKKYKNLKVFYASENGGTYRMRNSLWIRAKYDNLLFFDSDDVMPEDFVGGNMKYIDDYGFIRYRIMTFTNGKSKIKHTLPNWYAMGSIFIKKSILKILNGFRDERISMDMDLILRAKKFGVKEFQNANSFFWYREHQNQLTKDKSTSLKSQQRKIVNDEIYKRLSKNLLINDKVVINKSCKVL